MQACGCPWSKSPSARPGARIAAELKYAVLTVSVAFIGGIDSHRQKRLFGPRAKRTGVSTNGGQKICGTALAPSTKEISAALRCGGHKAASARVEEHDTE
jgi:hypothetical protein